jgi:hypothetical protein
MPWTSPTHASPAFPKPLPGDTTCPEKQVYEMALAIQNEDRRVGLIHMIQCRTTIFPVILPVSDAEQRLNGRDKVKALSRLARSALMQSCEKSGLHLDAFPKNEKGAPFR